MNVNKKSGVVAGVVVLVLGGVVFGQGSSPGAPALPGKPGEVPAGGGEGKVVTPETKMEIPVKPAPKVDAAAEALLDRLEKADQGLKSLTAKVQYVKSFAEIAGGGSHTWRGTLVYQDQGKRASGRPLRVFAVKFDVTLIDGKKRDEQQEYIFDGQWLLAKTVAEKQYTRAEIATAEGTDDPLRIGQGPLPLPIGQRKSDMVERFEVSVPPVLEGIDPAPELAGLRKLLEGTDQVKLLPRAGQDVARNFREIRLWYRKSDCVPLFAQTVNMDDSRSEVLLSEVKVNGEIEKGTFSTVAPEGWTGEERKKGK